MVWPFDPTVYAGLLGLWFGHAWLARDRDLPRIATLYFGLGLLCIWLALETPVDVISDHYLDSVHMFQHVLLGVVAPPLLLLGLNRQMAGVLVRVPGVRAVTEPVAAQVLSAVVMIGWHIPVLYDATLYSDALHVLEHVAFIAGGVLFWWPVIGATAAHCRWRMSPMAQLLYLFIGTFPQDAVALALQFSRTPFYEFYTHVPRLVPGLDPVTDQTTAGAILMLFGKSSYFIGAAVVFLRWFNTEFQADLESAARAR
ncbi:MAG TPA: cytochrome c oxidase assembly protein [Candidatus Dormibacteraeota bacterium]